MSKATNFLTFGLGVAVGSIVTRYVVKKKYERIAQEEIDSVKEAFAKLSDKDEIREKADQAKDKPSVAEYAAILRNQQYVEENVEDEEEIPADVRISGVEQGDLPYIIPPEDFGEQDEYGAISLSYYADGILADDNDEKVIDIDGLVGVESLGHFGEYEDDSVFVRNDRLKCDFEILLREETYADILKQKPYLASANEADTE